MNNSQLSSLVFNTLFNELQTYAELPQMIERVAQDVANSEFDHFKEHSVAYHISGLTDVVLSIKHALEILEREVLLLNISLEDELDAEQLKRYNELKTSLVSFQ